MAAGMFGFSHRFECKYLVSSFEAEEVRLALAYHMELDPFCLRCPGNRYLNTSLYFDTPDFRCLRATETGEKNRYKLRARWYSGNLGEPAFFEEKRRITEVISKTRVGITVEDLRSVIQGREFSPHDLRVCKGTSPSEVSRLADKMQSVRAQPACYVRYYREAWAGIGHEYLRVTLDRDLHGHALLPEDAPAVDSPGWTAVHTTETVLEIKFERNVPPWLEAIVRRHNLRRISVPKYMLCMETLGLLGNRQRALRREMSIHPGRPLWINN